MNYEILERREQMTIITKVKYTLSDNSEIIVDVAHFMPKDEAEIQLGIENRFITEQKNI